MTLFIEAAVSSGLVINESKNEILKRNVNVRSVEEGPILNRQVFEGVQI